MQLSYPRPLPYAARLSAAGSPIGTLSSPAIHHAHAHSPAAPKDITARVLSGNTANIAVFALFQSGDGARLAALEEWYEHSGLARLEWPGYLRHLEAVPDAQPRSEVEALAQDEQAQHLFHQRLMDVRLAAALRAPEGVDAGNADALAQLQREFDARAATIATYRFLQRHSELDPLRLVTHAFLHADAMHLFGNMFFLAALGLLVEGALGPWRFALLYLVGTVGSGLFSAAWNWGDPGGGLGASGAIAALMGAFCVLWGTRPVRFFWWFFVVFDYVKKPAIWLLPAWIGWEQPDSTRIWVVSSPARAWAGCWCAPGRCGMPSWTRSTCRSTPTRNWPTSAV